jgi:hypothetical protein
MFKNLHCSFLDCSIVLSFKWIQTFVKNMLSPSSGLKCVQHVAKIQNIHHRYHLYKYYRYCENAFYASHAFIFRPRIGYGKIPILLSLLMSIHIFWTVIIRAQE